MLGAAPPTPTPTPTAAPASAAARAPKPKTARRIYYATADGTSVYAAPSSSSSVVGSLSLNEKVLRARVDRGYALIESTKTGVKGWVDNARLTWKAPGTQPRTAPAAPAPPSEEPEAAEEEGEDAQPEPAPESTPTIAEPTAVPTRKPTPGGVGPSIFNPY
jgi:hypothetical protein